MQSFIRCTETCLAPRVPWLLRTTTNCMARLLVVSSSQLPCVVTVVSKTFLFLGFSFSDPNLDYILSRIRILLGNNRREHYCLMRTVQRQDFKKSADFQYARTKQTLQIKDLERYGIMAVLLDSFRAVRGHSYLLRTNLSHAAEVFISGSATTYNPWTEQEAHQFLTLLGRRLAENGMTVITGFGLGVGPQVINGVLEQLEKEGTRNISDHLVLRPFPYAIKDPNRRKERWNSYRREMISQAGIAIFVFGNRKSESGAVVPADGMMEEFRIATEMRPKCSTSWRYWIGCGKSTTIKSRRNSVRIILNTLKVLRRHSEI